MAIRESIIEFREIKEKMIFASGAPGTYIFTVASRKLDPIINAVKLDIIFVSRGTKGSETMLLIGGVLRTEKKDVEQILKQIYEL